MKPGYKINPPLSSNPDYIVVDNYPTLNEVSNHFYRGSFPYPILNNFTVAIFKIKYKNQ